MHRFWIAVAMMPALMVGCESKPADDTSSNETTASVEAVETQPGDIQAIAETAVVDEGVKLTSAIAPEDSTATDDVESTEEGQELTPEQIKQAINQKLQAAMQARDAEQVIAILEAGREQLPGDSDVAMTLLSFQLQNDMQKAESPDKESVVAGFLKTAALADEVFGTEEINDPRLAQLKQLATFNKARALAHSDKVDEALEALAAAYDQGFEQYRGLDKDPFFAAIADQPGFQKVISDNTDRLKAKYRDLAREEFAASPEMEFDFDLPDLEGNSVKLADFAGKVVIVDVWGTWCPPCRMEIPHFIELRDKFKDDLEIVGITYEQVPDEEVAIKQISEFVKAEGVNYPCVLGDEATQNLLEVRGFPTTVFIDREGNVRLKVVGYHPYEKLEGYVAELIGGEKPST